jgi:hypothetical protein
LNGDRRWIEAARQAAEFAETWIYCWKIALPSNDAKMVFPRGRTSVGLSLIATGHSGSDSYMAAAPFLFYRLWLLTNDAHVRDVARMLLFNTKQMVDWDNSLGYKFPALQVEALSMPPLRGHGVQGWLPWLTVAQIEPMLRLKETFGAFDIAAIEKQSPAQLRRRNAAFGATRGFAPRTKP